MSPQHQTQDHQDRDQDRGIADLSFNFRKVLAGWVLPSSLLFGTAGFASEDREMNSIEQRSHPTTQRDEPNTKPEDAQDINPTRLYTSGPYTIDRLIEEAKALKLSTEDTDLLRSRPELSLALATQLMNGYLAEGKTEQALVLAEQFFDPEWHSLEEIPMLSASSSGYEKLSRSERNLTEKLESEELSTQELKRLAVVSAFLGRTDYLRDSLAQREADSYGCVNGIPQAEILFFFLSSAEPRFPLSEEALERRISLELERVYAIYSPIGSAQGVGNGEHATEPEVEMGLSRVMKCYQVSLSAGFPERARQVRAGLDVHLPEKYHGAAVEALLLKAALQSGTPCELDTQSAYGIYSLRGGLNPKVLDTAAKLLISQGQPELGLGLIEGACEEYLGALTVVGNLKKRVDSEAGLSPEQFRKELERVQRLEYGNSNIEGVIQVMDEVLLKLEAASGRPHSNLRIQGHLRNFSDLLNRVLKAELLQLDLLQDELRKKLHHFTS